jgi:hypothetical protein
MESGVRMVLVYLLNVFGIVGEFWRSYFANRMRIMVEFFGMNRF